MKQSRYTEEPSWWKCRCCSGTRSCASRRTCTRTCSSRRPRRQPAEWTRFSVGASDSGSIAVERRSRVPQPANCLRIHGAGGQTRTDDLLITKQGPTAPRGRMFLSCKGPVSRVVAVGGPEGTPVPEDVAESCRRLSPSAARSTSRLRPSLVGPPVLLLLEKAFWKGHRGGRDGAKEVRVGGYVLVGRTGRAQESRATRTTRSPASRWSTPRWPIRHARTESLPGPLR